ncbi:metallophosphoesterase family protein [Clostridium sp. LP20]|uniref:metallophosphoesterase family protein n=1 Tax=Clostridium sp. LP20 TaxID=3418665 RepID=UPI003EE7FEEB
MIYVMSDIHGYYNSFIRMLEKINFTEEDTLYILGDLIDRGPQGIKLIEYCRNNPNIIVLKGNHEYMLETYKRDEQMNKCWLRSGGLDTLDELESNYGANSEYEKDIISWIEKLPLFMEVSVGGESYLLTHAGLSKELFDKYCKRNKYGKFHKIDLPDLFEWAVEYLDWNDSNILWSKGIFDSKFIFTKGSLVVGHTPTSSKKIEKKKKVYNIDCGSYEKGGALGCLCLDNLKEFYVKVID